MALSKLQEAVWELCEYWGLGPNVIDEKYIWNIMSSIAEAEAYFDALSDQITDEDRARISLMLEQALFQADGGKEN